MLTGLLTVSLALAQDPPVRTLPDVPSVADLQAAELQRLHHGARSTLLAGAGLAIAAWPAAGLTGLAMESNCQFECMSAALGAAGTWSVLTAASVVTLGVGGVELALAPHRARNRVDREVADARFTAALRGE